MAVPVARVHLPGLLPTPAACVPIVFLPAKSPSKPKPGRADAAERWDAHKTSRPGSPNPSSSSGSSPRSASSSPGRASSCDRWDSNKKLPCSADTRTPLWGKKKPADTDSSSKRRPVSRPSSAAERWDLHQKPRAHGYGGRGSDDDDKETTMDDKLTMMVAPQAVYAGPGFLGSPEPCMLPIPAFMLRAR